MPEYHKDQLPEDGLHVAIRWRVPTQVARDALVLTDADVGGLLVQDDVMSLFVLLSAAPVTWSQVPDGDSTLAAILAVNAEVLERVEGPSVANDNAIALFDGSTGKLLKESLVSIDNLGNITTGGMVDGVDISNLAMALALVAVPDYVTLSSTPTLGNERTLTAGPGISITDGGAGGPVTIGNTASGAPATSQYLTLAADATLTNERVLTAGPGVQLVDGGAGGALTVSSQRLFSSQVGPYTLVLADAWKAVGVSSGTDTTLTIPANATVPFPVGTSITVFQQSTGKVTITPAGGVTVQTSAGKTLVTSGQYAVATLTQLVANVWNVTGELEATASFLTLGASAQLANERILTAGAGVQFADAGAGAALTVSANLMVTVQGGTAYTLALTDAGKVIQTSNAATVTVTIPTFATIPFAVGNVVKIWQAAAGQVLLAPAGGVTVTVPAGKSAASVGLFGTITLVNVAANVWYATGDLAPVLALNNQTGTTYTLALADGDKCVTMNNAAANTLTIPANASVAFPIGTVITVMQLGVGQTTIAITTDTLLNPALTAKLRARYSVASITKITATSWVLSGDLAAS